MNILQYESKIWETADLLRGSGIKESEWPSYMMPFFALTMIESRLFRMYDDFKYEIGEEDFANINKDDRNDIIRDKGQGYNVHIFEHDKTLTEICKNDKSFDIDFDSYLKGFDGETKEVVYQKFCKYNLYTLSPSFFGYCSIPKYLLPVIQSSLMSISIENTSFNTDF